MKIIYIFLISLIVLTKSQDPTDPFPSSGEAWNFYKECQESNPKTAGSYNCKCRKHPVQLFLGNKLKVAPICLPTSTAYPGGGILGSLQGRTAWTYTNENGGNGAPLPLHSLIINDDLIVITWAEDQGGVNWRNEGGRIHVAEIQGMNSIPTVKREVVLQGCVFNGEIVRNNAGNLVTLCPKVCGPSSGCPLSKEGGTNTLDMHIVEIGYANFNIIRQKSVMIKECINDNWSCFPKASGTDARILKYSPELNRYAVWHNGRTGIHVADVLIILDENFNRVEKGTDTWACSEGHTGGMEMTYDPKTKDFYRMCTTDIDTPGLAFKKVGVSGGVYNVTGNEIKVADNMGWWSSMFTWPGSMVACGDFIFVVWHGVRSMQPGYNRWNYDGKYFTSEVDIGFAKIEAATGKILVKKWFGDAKIREKSAKLAPLDNTCNRFLLGYGAGNQNSKYPWNFYVQTIDGNGNQVTTRQLLGKTSFWYTDTPWISSRNGKVHWVTTWRRCKDGSPRTSPMKGDKCEIGNGEDGAGNLGYGSQWGWDQPEQKPTNGFKTNEAFITTYSVTNLPNLPVQNIPKETIITPKEPISCETWNEYHYHRKQFNIQKTMASMCCNGIVKWVAYGDISTLCDKTINDGLELVKNDGKKILDPSVWVDKVLNEGASLIISCPVTIKIKSATYGNLPNCSAPNVLTKVRAICENQKSCKVEALNSVFTDPCGGVQKRLNFTYGCTSYATTVLENDALEDDELNYTE